MTSLESNQTTLPLTFRLACSEEAGLLVQLVNSAYRGRAGWTTEAELLGGQRTDEEEIRELIQAENSMLLLCLQGADIVGSVNLQKTDDTAYLGMLVIRPDLQGRNIGKQLMQAAEEFVQQEWGVTKMKMTVITVRTELLEFYERRGYRRTGQIKPFPMDARAGIPLVDGLQFEVLEKGLAKNGDTTIR